MTVNNFSKQSISRLGIDDSKSELIEFLIQNEGLNSFDETEHFYYWFHKEEKVLRDNFGFLQYDKKPFIFNINEKEFDLNTFEGIAKLTIEVKSEKELSKIFNGNFNLGRREFFLRYSKKYNKLEYYTNISSIRCVKKRDLCLVQHIKHKYFMINEKNFVLFYINNNMPRYVSNKNAAFLNPYSPYNYNLGDYQKYVYKINRMLLSIHQKSKVYNDKNFLKSVLDIKYISNKFMFNSNTFDDVINKITKNRPVPKILLDKFPKSEVVYLYNIIDYDEVDKIIKFIYENLEIYNEKEERNKRNDIRSKDPVYFENTIRSIITDYLCVKFGSLIPDKNKKEFINPYIENRSFLNQIQLTPTMSNSQIIHDYVNMCEMQNLKLNLKIKSVNRLTQEHDRIAFNITAKNIPEIKVFKKYPDIKSEGNFEIEKISDKKRLIIESEIQKHCVKTYSNSINSGRCCIYSFLDHRDNKRYTLEIQKRYDETDKLVFILNQIKGKFNANPESHILFEIYGILLRNNIFPNFEMAKKQHKVLEESKKKNSPKNNNESFDFLNDLNNNEILPF